MASWSTMHPEHTDALAWILAPLAIVGGVVGITAVIEGSLGWSIAAGCVVLPALAFLGAWVRQRRRRRLISIADSFATLTRLVAVAVSEPSETATQQAIASGMDVIAALVGGRPEACVYRLENKVLQPCGVARNWTAYQVSRHAELVADARPTTLASTGLGEYLTAAMTEGGDGGVYWALLPDIDRSPGRDRVLAEHVKSHWPGVRSMACCELEWRNAAVGMLVLRSDRAGAFRSPDLAALRSVADALAPVVDQTQRVGSAEGEM